MFKKIIFTAFLFLSAMPAYASSLTQGQIQSLVALLQAFNVDQATISQVEVALNGTPVQTQIVGGASNPILTMNNSTTTQEVSMSSVTLGSFTIGGIPTSYITAKANVDSIMWGVPFSNLILENGDKEIQGILTVNDKFPTIYHLSKQSGLVNGGIIPRTSGSFDNLQNPYVWGDNTFTFTAAGQSVSMTVHIIQ